VSLNLIDLHLKALDFVNKSLFPGQSHEDQVYRIKFFTEEIAAAVLKDVEKNCTSFIDRTSTAWLEYKREILGNPLKEAKP
jgi:hypothetical protein